MRSVHDLSRIKPHARKKKKKKKKGLEIDCMSQPLIGRAVKSITRSFKCLELGALVTAYEEMVLRWHGF